jgi:hypothetical protein
VLAFVWKHLHATQSIAAPLLALPVFVRRIRPGFVAAIIHVIRPLLGVNGFVRDAGAAAECVSNDFVIREAFWALFADYKPLIGAAKTLWLTVWVPHFVAAHTLVAAALAAAAHAAANALTPDFARRDEQAVPRGESTVYEEHAVSVLSGIESVAVSPG